MSSPVLLPQYILPPPQSYFLWRGQQDKTGNVAWTRQLGGNIGVYLWLRKDTEGGKVANVEATSVLADVDDYNTAPASSMEEVESKENIFKQI